MQVKRICFGVLKKLVDIWGEDLIGTLYRLQLGDPLPNISPRPLCSDLMLANSKGMGLVLAWF